MPLTRQRDAVPAQLLVRKGKVSGIRRIYLLVSPEGVVEIGEDVVDVLEPDGESHHFRRDARGKLLVFIQLTVGRRRRVNRQ